MKRWRDENKASKAETPKAMTSLVVKKPHESSLRINGEIRCADSAYEFHLEALHIIRGPHRSDAQVGWGKRSATPQEQPVSLDVLGV